MCPLPGAGLVSWVQTLHDAKGKREEERAHRPAGKGTADRWSLKNFAAALRVSKTRVGELVRILPDFPQPIIRLAAAPVWLADAIRAFDRH